MEKEYSKAAVERAMKAQEVILRAMSGQLLWSQAASIIGVSDRTMRRWRERYEEYGYDGLFDARTGQPSPKRVPLETVEKVLRLYREEYFDFNVRHFHEKLVSEHGISLSYTWVKTALQGTWLLESSYRVVPVVRLIIGQIWFSVNAAEAPTEPNVGLDTKPCGTLECPKRTPGMLLSRRTLTSVA